MNLSLILAADEKHISYERFERKFLIGYMSIRPSVCLIALPPFRETRVHFTLKCSGSCIVYPHLFFLFFFFWTTFIHIIMCKSPMKNCTYLFSLVDNVVFIELFFDKAL